MLVEPDEEAMGKFLDRLLSGRERNIVIYLVIGSYFAI